MHSPSRAGEAIHPNELNETEMIELLRSGAHAAMLNAFFGEAQYRELRELAVAAIPAERSQPGPRVYLLPGLMGSKLGYRSGAHTNIYWLAPEVISKGQLSQLALPGRRRLRTLGVMVSGYLKLQLYLASAGFDVRVYSYDWRQSIGKLGRGLAAELQRDPAQEIFLVAHSMGGLVARVALRFPSGDKVRKLIQIGAPNQGSFASVQALRAVYPSVRKLAALDRLHDAETLSQRIFRTLPGLYEMLPPAEFCAGADLFDVKNWPQDRLKPEPRLLEKARRLQLRLAAADARCFCIAGTGQPTVVGVRRRPAGFDFICSNEGDGTVPLALAQWPGASNWCVQALHGELPKQTAVCRAVVDLLQHGATRKLRRHIRSAPAKIKVRSERALRKQLTGKLAWEQLPIEERRNLLEPKISPAFLALAARRKAKKKSGGA